MDLGSLGKSRTISELIRNGFDIFTEFEGKAPFDLVAHKDGELKRIEVKSTQRRTKYDTGWEIQIKRVRPNRSETVIHNFNSSQCDILAVYIEPLDKVLLLDSSKIKVKTMLTILDSELLES